MHGSASGKNQQDHRMFNMQAAAELQQHWPSAVTAEYSRVALCAQAVGEVAPCLSSTSAEVRVLADLQLQQCMQMQPRPRAVLQPAPLSNKCSWSTCSWLV
jgi:hypothetical protein